jgi:hypothetical protein
VTTRKTLADPKINISILTAAEVSKYLPMNDTVFTEIASATAKAPAGIHLVPQMDTGASDRVYLNVAGIPTYEEGYSAMRTTHGQMEKTNEFR